MLSQILQIWLDSCALVGAAALSIIEKTTGVGYPLSYEILTAIVIVLSVYACAHIKPVMPKWPKTSRLPGLN